MYKVVYNDIIIDVLHTANFVRYLPKSRRFIKSDESSSNGVMSRDADVVYHLIGKPIFPQENVKSVKLVEISEEVYNDLVSQLTDKSEIPDLTEEDKPISVESLKSEVTNLLSKVENLLKDNEFLTECLLEMSGKLYE